MAIILILHISFRSRHVSVGNGIANALKHLGLDELCVEVDLDYADAISCTIIPKGCMWASEKSPNL